MILGQITSTPIIMVAGVVYPAYCTFKATQKGADAAEATRWLHYWMIFAAFSTIEWLVDLIGAYLPFYYEAKLCFVYWLTPAAPLSDTLDGQSTQVAASADIVGYVSFTLFSSHVNSEAKLDNVVTLLVGFRNYLQAGCLWEYFGVDCA